jgi:hypothetical protein
MDINNVGKPFLLLDTFKYMKELNLERNSVIESNVISLSLFPIP